MDIVHMSFVNHWQSPLDCISVYANLYVTIVSENKLCLSMKNGVFWVVTPCGSCKNRRFGGTWRLLHQGDKIDELHFFAAYVGC
jgi:hypothetical protein